MKDFDCPLLQIAQALSALELLYGSLGFEKLLKKSPGGSDGVVNKHSKIQRAQTTFGFRTIKVQPRIISWLPNGAW